MRRVLKDLGIVVRELLYALVAQPSRPGATREEAEGNQTQEEQLQDNLRRPASAREAAGRVAREVGKAAILQPTDRARRRPRR
ncbi:hypothetical protein [Deinococcus apachensis]|uniref:hypothetical protein n=1 Tax=Deinococcus apachensis TaxID=309886 RepID=UPI000382160F|nr:hypothetical protein [Deinococcus apachensis]